MEVPTLRPDQDSVRVVVTLGSGIMTIGSLRVRLDSTDGDDVSDE